MKVYEIIIDPGNALVPSLLSETMLIQILTAIRLH